MGALRRFVLKVFVPHVNDKHMSCNKCKAEITPNEVYREYDGGKWHECSDCWIEDFRNE